MVDTPTLLESVSGSPREGRDSPVCVDGGSAPDGKERTGRAVLEKCVAEMERQVSSSSRTNLRNQHCYDSV
jgi:hypothetical protein